MMDVFELSHNIFKIKLIYIYIFISESRAPAYKTKVDDCFVFDSTTIIKPKSEVDNDLVEFF